MEAMPRPRTPRRPMPSTPAAYGRAPSVPLETVRNWEQGKRSPRGPARALLKVIDKAPDVAFAVLRTAKPEA